MATVETKAKLPVYWFKVNDALVYYACVGVYVVDAIEGVLQKYATLGRSVFDVSVCKQGGQELQFQSELTELDDTANEPIALEFKEQATSKSTAMRPATVATVSNRATKADKELEHILEAAEELGLTIDVVCANYSADDELLQKSTTRGSAEGARGDIIDLIKGSFRDSHTWKGRRANRDLRPVDVQATYSLNLLSPKYQNRLTFECKELSSRMFLLVWQYGESVLS